MSQDKAEILQGFLSNLSPSSAATLAGALERGRLHGTLNLPHEQILAGLRPALQRAEASVPRTLTPLRLFCQPFEDLLGIGHGEEKQRGRILRSSIMPVWDWLGADLMPGRLKLLSDSVSDAIRSGDARRVRDATTQLHGICGMTLARALGGLQPDTSDHAALAKRLGGPIVVEDARDMAMVLEIADDALALCDRLPRPIQTLDEEHIVEIRTIYESIEEHLPEHALYVVFIAMGRMAKPWQVLRLIGRLTNQTSDVLASRTDIGACGALLFADLAQSVSFFSSIDPEAADYLDIVHQLTYFVGLSQGVTLELDIKRDGDWGNLLTDARSRVATRMEIFLKRAIKGIKNAVPLKGSGGLGAAKPDVATAPDPLSVKHALAFAKFLAAVRYLAEPAAFAGVYTALVPEFVDSVKSYVGQTTEAIRTATPETRDAIEAHAALGLGLCQALLAEEQADVIHRQVELARKEAA